MRNRFKKTLAVFSQSVKTAKALYDMDFSTLHTDGSYSDNLNSEKTLCAMFNSTIKGKWIKNRIYDFYPEQLGRQCDTYYMCSSYSLYQLNDGSSILYSTYNPTQFGTSGFPNCTQEHPCHAIIDANGPYEKPNKIVECKEDNVGHHMADDCNETTYGDLFPVIFYDDVVKPATKAVEEVLINGK
jgi:hypothetical protein